MGESGQANGRLRSNGRSLMLTYIYAGEIYCEECGRAIREKLKTESKVPIFPDNPWSYESKDYPKGPYHSNEHTHGPQFSCARCNAPLGSLAIHQPENRIIDPWTDSLPPKNISKAGYKDYIPRIAKLHVDSEANPRRYGRLPLK